MKRPRESAVPPELAARATLALWLALAVLVAARGVCAFVPFMLAWGLNLLRFLPAWLGWSTWAITAVTLVPPVARWLGPRCAAIGDFIGARPVVAASIAGSLAAAAVVLAPDRVQLVGDYLHRLGAALRLDSPSLVMPQALPLDLWLHHTLPRMVWKATGLDPNDWARVLGAMEAATLVALGLAFARELGFRGIAAFAAATIAGLTGVLGLCTGFAKAFTETSILAAVIAVFGTRVARSGHGLLPVSIAIVIGLYSHRSALGFLPALLATWFVWTRRHGLAAWTRPVPLLALAMPLVVLVTMTPRIIAAVRSIDHVNFAPEGSGLAQLVITALRPEQLSNLVNVVIQISPVALAVPPLAVMLLPALRRRPEARVLFALALPLLALLFAVHPQQGVFL